MLRRRFRLDLIDKYVHRTPQQGHVCVFLESGSSIFLGSNQKRNVLERLVHSKTQRNKCSYLFMTEINLT